MIERKSGMPYYLQVADYLMEKIESQEYPVGEKIPSEWELSRLFDVNRHTVRQAVAKLVSIGLVTTVKGLGSYVKSTPVIPYYLSQQTRFTENVDSLGKSPKSELLDWSKGLPTEHERQQLALDRQEKVYRMDILRSIDGTPYSMSTTVLPEKFVPSLDTHLDDFNSLYRILQQQYGFRPIRLRSIIKAKSCVPMDARYLPEDVPIIYVESLAIHPITKMPVEIAIGRTRGDMNEMVVQFGNGGEPSGYEATNKNPE
ncbi:GntR family transcriptional regulator [Alicyclobacillus fastidiosus]|uniref:GntR family transcriptional regulator n=1 Tax=Alicyclobacillus fastidiosus TaxID=392011 RepID=A0ABY6ZNH9_9BACL|nr:GntR family transcriptional regulator [Alicyclobacillus fastidiosus]WAH44133.1 GntR family transcriptional regulator [Alicyclobacillus fastidiosus]GMA60435.1 phosphonate metabolism transcriptional regulator PhnF [Alicyclobacillus fastidiosus]